MKTLTAHYSSEGRVEFTDLLTGKPRPIRCPVLCGFCELIGYCVIAMATCGSELLVTALCMYTTEERTFLRRLTAYRAMGSMPFLRIVKALFGRARLPALTAFATSRRQP